MNELKSNELLPFVREIARPFRWHLLGLVFVAIVWAIDLSLRPYLLKIILDRLSEAPPELVFEALTTPALLYVGVTLFIFVTLRFWDVVSLTMKPRLEQRARVYLIDHMMGHSHGYYQNNFPGALANKINDVSHYLPEVLAVIVDRFLSHGLALIIAIASFWILVSPKFALLMFVWVTIFLTVSIYWASKSHELSDNLAELESDVTGKIVDILSNAVAFLLFATQRKESENVKYWTEKIVQATRKLDWFFFRIWTFQGLSFVALQVVSLILLMYGRRDGTISVGDFALILTINMHIVDALWNIAKDFAQFSERLGKVTQGLRLTTMPHEIVDAADATPLTVTKGEIRFKSVEFSYAGAEPLFSKKSIVIKGGQKVGLVGYSGSGKSTFINLILRIFELHAGQILIDGIDIAKITQESLRKAIGMIPQDPVMFNRSVLENIRYGRLQATDEEVVEAARKAFAHEFIEKMPFAYEALVGDRGVKLSGGQRQRIAIARAIIKNAPILLLDEATSALDSVTEEKIQESILELMKNKTTIVVAHRLSTLLYMDRILVFSQGKIVEDGTHEKLLEKRGIYSRLWNAQVGGFIPD